METDSVRGFPREYGSTSYRFEWEREWRVPSEVGFTPEDVSFLFLPQELHDRARTFFTEAERDGTGPNYPCPFLDPRWTIEEIQAALDQSL